MSIVRYEALPCQRFNESLDGNGPITIANVQFQPSRILFEMAYETYCDAYNEFLEQEYEELKQIVFDSFPACIAYNFRLSEKGEGANDPVRKLLHLKDTWEAIVFILYALVFGEVRKKGIILKAAQHFVSNNPGGNPIYAHYNTDKILSDTLKQRIQNVKGIILFGKANPVGCQFETIDESLCDDLLTLQNIRNDISHHAAPTREQAENELQQIGPVFREMLGKARFLEECQILRFENFSSNCRCETFNGHFLNREYESILFSPDQTPYVIGLGTEQIFVQWNSDCFSLSPFMHFERDATGHESYLAFFKGRKTGKFWFEPVKIRTEKAYDPLQSRFDAEKDEIVRLVVP